MRAWEKVVQINTIALVLAAVCCGANYWAGSFLFVYTSIIGFIDSIKVKNTHGMIINAAFLALNLFNSIRFILSLS